MRSSDKSLFLLGLDRVAEAKLLAWNERISALMEKKLSIEGLTLAIDFFEVCCFPMTHPELLDNPRVERQRRSARRAGT